MGRYIQKKTKVGIIGAGKVGTSLAVSFDKRKHTVYFLSKHYNNEIPAVSCISDEKSFFDSVDVIIIAVKDRDLKTIVNKLYQLKVKGKLIFHLSGFYSSDILGPLREKNVIGVFHPIFPFTKKFINIKNKKILADTEGDIIFLKKVKELFKDFKKLNLFEISKESKPVFHLGLTLVSNYPLYVVNVGKEILSPILCKTLLGEVMDSFLKATIENYLNSGNISGPLSRGDFEIIEKEISYLKDNRFKTVVDDIIRLSKKIKEIENGIKG